MIAAVMKASYALSAEIDKGKLARIATAVYGQNKVTP
jgi:hypothetical protein